MASSFVAQLMLYQGKTLAEAMATVTALEDVRGIPADEETTEAQDTPTVPAKKGEIT